MEKTVSTVDFNDKGIDSWKDFHKAATNPVINRAVKVVVGTIETPINKGGILTLITIVFEPVPANVFIEANGKTIISVDNYIRMDVSDKGN